MRLLSRLLKLEAKFMQPLPYSCELVLQKNGESSEDAYKRGKLASPRADKLILISFEIPKSY